MNSEVTILPFPELEEVAFAGPGADSQIEIPSPTFANSD